MASFNMYVINEGQPKVLNAYFHKSQAPLNRAELDRDVPEEVVIYGGYRSRDPVYLHLLVEDLVGVNAGNSLVREDIKIVVDLFAVDAARVASAYDENGLEHVEVDEELLSFSVEVAIGGLDLGQSKVTHRQCVTTRKANPPANPPDLTVTTLLAEAGHSLHHLCFEAPIEDHDLWDLDQLPSYTKRVLAWAWLISLHTKAKYAEGFWGTDGKGGLQIEKRDARMDFLRNGASLRQLLAFFERDKRMKHRGDYQVASPPGCRDPFVYDEPTKNSLRFSKYLPFTKIEIGAQMGSIGLCSNNLETYYRNNFLHRYVDLQGFLEKMVTSYSRTPEPKVLTTDVVIVQGKAGARPAVPGGIDFLDRSYPFAINELQNSYEDQYLFREGSFAQWLNAIEPEVVVGKAREPQPPPNSVVEPKSLQRFTSGKYDKASKLPILSFDFLGDYRDHVPDANTMGQTVAVFNVLEQKEVDLSDYETISTPQMNLSCESGQYVARLGKGFPFPGGNQDFLPNWLHTKIKVEGDPADSDWQAHPYAHRPVLLSYELERDLRAAEGDKLLNAWKSGKPADSMSLALTLWSPESIWDSPNSSNLFRMAMPFPFLDARCGKKGKHLVLLYLTSPRGGRLWITLHPNGSVENKPTNLNILGVVAGEKDPSRRECRAVELQMAGSPSVVTYRATDSKGLPYDGLFTGNPLITLESSTPLETRARLAAADISKFEYTAASAEGKFILAFLPTYGSAAGATWELGTKLVEYFSDNTKAFPRGKAIETGSEVVKTLLTELLKLRNIKLPGAVGTLLSDSKAAGSFLDKLDGDLADLRKKIGAEVSPLKRAAELQKSPFVKEELILLRVLRREWKLQADSKGITASPPLEEEALDAFFVRAVDLPTGTRTPFTYCFGPRGGLLERSEPNKSCSLQDLRREYLLKLHEYKKLADSGDERTLEDHLRWISEPAHLQGIPFNENLKGFLVAHAGRLAEVSGRRSGLVGKGMVRTDAEAKELEYLLTTVHLWQYLSSTEIICPACGNVMQMNWGWCPYHPTNDDKLIVFPDANRSGSWNDEFRAYLTLDSGHGGLNNPTVASCLATPCDPKRLFVHCSEFVVLK